MPAKVPVDNIAQAFKYTGTRDVGRRIIVLKLSLLFGSKIRQIEISQTWLI